MKIVFMGTPDLAAGILETMLKDGRQVSLVITQPDRQKGRGKSIVKSPVKICAEKYGIPVFQPERVRKPEAVERIRQEEPDLIVVAAFGQILPQKLLDIPKYGCINVHTSLLPKYRGAAPIQWAIINGEKKSGVTIMQMDAGLDTGDILMQEELELDPKETAETLFDKLADMGGPLLLRTIDAMEAGTVTRTPQSDRQTFYASMFSREMGEIDWNRTATDIERLIRGLNPWPSAYTGYHGKLLKIWDADVLSAEDSFPGSDALEEARPGDVLGVDKNRIYVMTGEGVLAINEVQIEGKKRRPVRSFLLGYKVCSGDRLHR